MIRRFASGSPAIQLPERRVELTLSRDAFYADPQLHIPALYERFGTLGP